MIEWRRKLASRKFCALAAGVATSVILLVRAGKEVALTFGQKRVHAVKEEGSSAVVGIS